MAATKVRGVSVRDSLASLKVGTEEVFTAKTRVLLAGKEYDQAALLKAIERFASKYDAAAAAQADAAVKVAQREAIAEEAKSFAATLSGLVLAMHKGDTATLLKFGVSEPKPARALSAEQRAASVAKALATRKARNAVVARNQEDGSVATTNVVAVATGSPKEVNGASH